MSGNTQISVKNLCKSFNQFNAINDISFNVNKGEVMGFLGPNGAGKSTTMKIITGFMSADSGSVLVNNLDVEKHPLEIKKMIGYLPEGAPAYGDMTTAGFLGFIADIRGYTGRQKKQQINTAVDRTNLGSVLHKTIDTLSKGFKRRVGLAQAILHDPLILIMDEPTDGLDPNQKHEVRKLINEMSEDKAILISTHILEEVNAICKHVAIMAQGNMVFDGSADELQALSPSHNSVKLKFAGQSPPQAQQKIEQLNGVANVSFHSQSNYFIINPVSSAYILTSITNMIHSKGWNIEEAFVIPGKLDDVFRYLTRQPDPQKNTTTNC